MIIRVWMALSALTVRSDQQASELPNRYGVMSPAAGLGAPYLKRLESTPIEMNILEVVSTLSK